MTGAPPGWTGISKPCWKRENQGQTPRTPRELSRDKCIFIDLK